MKKCIFWNHPLFEAMEPHWRECFTRQGKKEKIAERKEKPILKKPEHRAE